MVWLPDWYRRWNAPTIDADPPSPPSKTPRQFVLAFDPNQFWKVLRGGKGIGTLNGQACSFNYKTGTVTVTLT